MLRSGPTVDYMLGCARGMVIHLQANPHRSHGRWLCAGGRDSHRISGARPRVDQTRLSPDPVPTGEGCLLPLGDQPGDGLYRASGGAAVQGVIQCNGYGTYRASADRHENIELSDCWTHARCKVHEALEQTPLRADWNMRQFQHLYRIESVLRENRAGPVLRQALHSRQSPPILERLRKALVCSRPAGNICRRVCKAKPLTRSRPVDSALALLGRWPRGERQQPREKAIRPTALSKKNSHFIGEAGGLSAWRRHPYLAKCHATLTAGDQSRYNYISRPQGLLAADALLLEGSSVKYFPVAAS